MEQTQVPLLPTPEQAFEMFKPAVDDTTEALPMLTVCIDNKLNLIVLAVDIPPRHILESILARLVAEEGQPDWLTFASEVWVQKSNDRIPGMPMSMQELHHAGDTSVQEAVMILGVSRTRDWSYERHFIRSPDGMTWLEPNIYRSDEESQRLYSGGPLLEILRRAVRGASS